MRSSVFFWFIIIGTSVIVCTVGALYSISFLFLGLLVFYQVKNTPMKNIPGPIGWPIVGNTFQLPKHNPHIELTKLAKVHGPVFKLKLGSSYGVVVNDYASIYEVLVKKGKDFAGRRQTWRKKYAFGGHLGISGSDPTEQWKLGRKIIHSSLKAFGSGMQRIERMALEITDDFLDAFQRTNGRPTDPEPILFSGVIRMISLLVYGENFAEGSKPYTNVIDGHKEIIHGIVNSMPAILLDVFPFVRFLGNRVFQHLKKGNEYIDDLWENEVLKKLHTWDLESPEQSLPAVPALFAYEKSKGVQFDDLYKKTSGIHLTFSGVVTTTYSMLSLLLILIHHPEVQSKIQEEIDDMLGENTIGLNHLADLPFTKAALYEMQRYASNIAINVEHKTLKNTSIGHYELPKDSFVLANLWALHHDEEFWEDPFVYRPERFLDHQGQLVPADHQNRRHLLIFSAGPRVCPGETMAQARMFLWTVSILQRFTLKPEGKFPTVPCDPRSFIPSQVLKPQPYKLRFLPRK